VRANYTLSEAKPRIHVLFVRTKYEYLTYTTVIGNSFDRTKRINKFDIYILRVLSLSFYDLN